MTHILLTLILIANAIFWGLFPHSSHCALVSRFTSQPCLPHYIHILIGIVFYLLSVLTQNKSYISYLLKI